MAYTPELSYESSCVLRRIAWFMDLPMTKAIELIFDKLPDIMNKDEVCSKCRQPLDCDTCKFNTTKENSHATAYNTRKNIRQNRYVI
ncbi:MAG: hypothetical protein WCQ90_12010 [Deltaproteobacteria bacterium]